MSWTAAAVLGLGPSYPACAALGLRRIHWLAALQRGPDLLLHEDPCSSPLGWGWQCCHLGQAFPGAPPLCGPASKASRPSAQPHLAAEQAVGH